MVGGRNEDNFLILNLLTGQNRTGSDAANSTLLDYKQGYYGSLLAVSDEVAIVRFTGAGLTAL